MATPDDPNGVTSIVRSVVPGRRHFQIRRDRAVFFIRLAANGDRIALKQHRQLRVDSIDLLKLHAAGTGQLSVALEMREHICAQR